MNLRLVLASLFLSWSAFASAQKINGVSLVGHPTPVEQSCFDQIEETNANWVALMPYAFVRQNSGDLIYNTDRQWWGEKAEGVQKCVEMAKSNNMKVMIKPHLWIGHGAYTGDLEFETEEDWITWESNYREYILLYARMSEEYQLDLFCIGTELETFVTERLEFWSALIRDVRQVFSGKLVYAANWDEYQRFPFWKELDYIGVDAYFPLDENQTPITSDIIKSWQPHYQELKAFSMSKSLQVLFTEFGYRSVDFTTRRPWESHRNESLNLEAQTNALDAIFNVFWPEHWFAGGFLWKWHAEDEKIDPNQNNRFTPQNKPAEEVVRKWFAWK
ncbi:glycoside hydrolase family 113 [Halocola ammonii]